MSDNIKIGSRLRFGSFNSRLEKAIRQANKVAAMELRDNVKGLLNVAGFQIRQKGELGSAGYVIRKGRRVEAVKGKSQIAFKKNEINFDVERSKPGEPPRRQRGLLYNSMTFEVRDSFRGVKARVGPSVRVARYARALELGYAPGGLAPRPYLAPAAKDYQPTYEARIANAVKGAT